MTAPANLTHLGIETRRPALDSSGECSSSQLPSSGLLGLGSIFDLRFAGARVGGGGDKRKKSPLWGFDSGEAVPLPLDNLVYAALSFTALLHNCNDA